MDIDKCEVYSVPREDWREIYDSVEEVERYLESFVYAGEGWYITDSDTMFMTKLEDGRIKVQVWNYSTAREEILKAVLGFSVFLKR
jgi:hypothetical protein